MASGFIRGYICNFCCCAEGGQGVQPLAANVLAIEAGRCVGEDEIFLIHYYERAFIVDNML